MKKLIVYYSYSNNTRSIVNKIKEKVDCDILELTPLDAYSNDYQTVVDQGYLEVEDKYEPDINEDLNIVDNYDTIILGFPIWWYHVAPVIRTFLHEAKLDNKTIIPFVTNGGYGVGYSKKDINKYCKNSKVLDIFDIPFEEDKIQIDEVDINNFIDKINKM